MESAESIGTPVEMLDHVLTLLRDSQRGLRATVTHKPTATQKTYYVSPKSKTFFMYPRQWQRKEISVFLESLAPPPMLLSHGVLSAAVNTWQSGSVLAACQMIHALTPSSCIYVFDEEWGRAPKNILVTLDPPIDWLPTPETAPIAGALAYLVHGYHPILLHHVEDWLPTGEPVCSCFKGFTCKAAGKHPRRSGWKKKCPTEMEIEEWWGLYPKSNVGLAMGGEKRIVAIDIDGVLGHESLAELEKEHEPLPPTLTQQTGREGGEQRIYRVPDELDIKCIRNTVGDLGHGLDVRGAGSLIVVAPSQHKSHKYYQWKEIRPVADLPKWLYDLMTAAKFRPSVERPGGDVFTSNADRPPESNLPPIELRTVWAINEVSKMPPAIQGDNGSRATIRAAIACIRGYCLPPQDALQVLMQYYNPRCKPRWAQWEMAHKVESAEENVSVVPWGYLMPDVCPRAPISEEQAAALLAAMFVGGANESPSPRAE